MKKILSIIMTFAMFCGIFSALGIECRAAGSTDNAHASSYSVYSSGDYTGGVAESALSAEEYYDSASSVANTVLASGGEYCESISAAAAVLRQAMANWQSSTINVYYKSASYSSSYYSEIMETALEHTGIATQGDYLYWGYSGYSVDWTYSYESGYYYISFFYKVTYYTTAAQESALTTAIESLTASLGMSSMTDYERVLAIYSYICENITYDYDNLYDSDYKLKFTAYAALINKTAVCQGIAILIYRLCNMYDIDCRVIASSSHAWNIVKLDGYYYNLDATWDLGCSEGEYSYFLKCNASFGSHTRASEYDTSAFNSTYVMSTTDYTFSNYTLSNCVITLSYTSCLYDGSEKKPTVTVTYNSSALTPSSDYTLSYENNVKVGTAQVTIDGKGNYSGSTTRTFTIYENSHSYDSGVVTKEATCGENGTVVYTCCGCGATNTQTIARTACHTWGSAKFTTKATTEQNGVATYTCTVCGATKTKTYAKIKSVTLSTTSYTYNGKAKTPTVTVKNANGDKISSKYYTVTYINRATGKTVSSMKSAGKYYVKIKFNTKYSGTVKKAVTIKPKATSIKSVTASSKGFTVKWGKVTSCTTGYQIQYSTDKSFSSKTTKTVTDNTKTSKKITGLKAKKKYYVRVRTYKTVTINGKSTKIYSSWSDIKPVTTKQ
ncbi:MAG: fibronectin type III domain-containing protein [Clostridiales bacterium]|nr:fibronectin type III domain-containing protein [Clostridiales bacterium]